MYGGNKEIHTYMLYTCKECVSVELSRYTNVLGFLFRSIQCRLGRSTQYDVSLKVGKNFLCNFQLKDKLQIMKFLPLLLNCLVEGFFYLKSVNSGNLSQRRSTVEIKIGVFRQPHNHIWKK